MENGTGLRDRLVVLRSSRMSARAGIAGERPPSTESARCFALNSAGVKYPRLECGRTSRCSGSATAPTRRSASTHGGAIMTDRNSSRGRFFAGCRPPRSKMAFVDPGKPWQNGTDESFNGKLRDQHSADASYGQLFYRALPTALKPALGQCSLVSIPMGQNGNPCWIAEIPPAPILIRGNGPHLVV